METNLVELQRIAETNAPAEGVHIQVERVERAFGELRVLKGLDLEIKPGEFVAIVGRSGCGKSTLLRLLAGLDQADGGSIRFDERPLAAGKARDDVRIMFQEPRLLPWKTVLQNVALGLGVRAQADARAALTRVG